MDHTLISVIEPSLVILSQTVLNKFEMCCQNNHSQNVDAFRQ